MHMYLVHVSDERERKWGKRNHNNKEKHQHMFTSYRDLSGKDICHQLWQLETEGICYVADKAIDSQYEFTFNKDFKGDILVPKKGDKSILEFILSGVFQIDAWNFLMTSDAKWNPNNTIGTHFEQVKPSCHLLPVQHDPDFAFSSDDFPAIIANLWAIENLGDACKGHDNISVIIGDAMHSTSAIKLMHHLFVICTWFDLVFYLLTCFWKDKEFFWCWWW